MTLQALRRHRVAILKGGWSKERAISLKTAQSVEAACRRLKIPFFSIDVSRNIDHVLRKKKPTFCFIALHGEFGEDGGIQRLLDLMKIPYSGTDALSSAICMDKEVTKALLREANVPVVPGFVVSKTEYRTHKKDLLAPWARSFRSAPLFVKPVDQGSAIGASRVNRISELSTALEQCFKVSDRALVEKYIQGRELTVGILGDMALPVVEIVPEHSFYDFHSKYAAGGSTHIVPARLSPKQTDQAKKLSLKSFKALRASVYGRIDLMLDDGGRFYVLEANTIPGMTTTSLLPDAAKAAGLSFDQLVVEIIRLSLEKSC